MSKSLVNKSLFIISTLCSLTLNANNYTLAPASTPVKVDANLEFLKQLSIANQKLAESCKRGLVFISVSKTMKGQNYVDPFEFFFGGPGPMGPQEAPKQEGFGSGFIVDLDKGYILTNNHVVESSDKITLKFANGKSYEGKVIGLDKDTDVAVVQVKDHKFSRDNLSALVLDDSDKLSIGAPVFAMGSPFLLEMSVTSGIISAVGRGNMQLTKMGNFIQTDAAINPGNSGGPLINMDGKVVGINTAIFSQSGAYAGIGFAIPSNIARRIATALINTGSFYKGFVGISFDVLRDDWVKSLDLPKGTKGIIVGEVQVGGPAYTAGLQPGDVIVSVDGKSFEPENLTSIIGLREPGAGIDFSIYRQGKKMDVSMKVGTAPTHRQQLASRDSDGDDNQGSQQEAAPKTDRFGFELRPINEALRKDYAFRSNHGVVIVYVESLSPAWHAGFREGDVITNVNGKKVNSVNDFDNITKNRQTVLLQIERKGRSAFFQIESKKK